MVCLPPVLGNFAWLVSSFLQGAHSRAERRHCCRCDISVPGPSAQSCQRTEPVQAANIKLMVSECLLPDLNPHRAAKASSHGGWGPVRAQPPGPEVVNCLDPLGLSFLQQLQKHRTPDHQPCAHMCIMWP